MKLARSVQFGIAALALSCSAHADEYTLRFAEGACGGVLSCGYAGVISQDYGDTALVNVTYSNMLSGGSLNSWNDSFSNLSFVVYANGIDIASHARITLTAAAGQTVTLKGFDLGAWAQPGTSPVVLNTNVWVASSSNSGLSAPYSVGAGGLATSFSNFGTAGMGQTVTIDWYNDAFKVGLDNLNFSVSAVTAVPEPETYALLLAGLGLLGAVARKKNRA